MTLRPALCPCSHGPEQHYADDRGVRWACCARGCTCPRWNARQTEPETPVRTVSDPADRDGPR